MMMIQFHFGLFILFPIGSGSVFIYFEQSSKVSLAMSHYAETLRVSHTP